MSNTLLYNPDNQSDACAVGLIGEVDGLPSRRVLEGAIEGLERMHHRTATGADGKTSDGAGIKLTKFSKDVFGAKPDDAVGMFFLPQNEKNRQQAQEIVKDVLTQAGFNMRWQSVETNPDVLGEDARKSMPHIEQLVIEKPEGIDPAQFEKDLFFARRKIEKLVKATGLAGEGAEDFYVSSMSAHSIVFKGQSTTAQLSNFYPVLKNPNLKAAVASIHGRFATNTTPKWRLAQPFRYIAHNGEINTIGGNRKVADLHALRIAKQAGVDVSGLLPIMTPGNSDSADADEAYEFRHIIGGYSAPTIKTQMMPEAQRSSSNFSPEMQQTYEYVYATDEPHDGPATWAMTDETGGYIGGDRNGLRPVRFVVTDDGLLWAGSEDGAISIPEACIVKRGNARPGEMIGISFEKGLMLDAALKQQAADELTGKALVEKIVDIQDGVVTPEDYELLETPEALRAAQRLAGFTDEGIKRTIDVMVKEGSAPIGAMGDDAAMAVLSKKYRPLYDFFVQQFSEVTDPPLDPIRERESMSLVTHLGSLYDENGQPNKDPQGRIASPYVTNAAYKNIEKFAGDKLAIIDCTYTEEEGLLNAIKRIKQQAEEAVRAGKNHLVLSDRSVSTDRKRIPALLATGGINNHLIQVGLRQQASINVRAGDAWSSHHLACLIGTGADTANFYMAEESIAANHAKGAYLKFEGDVCADQPTLAEAIHRYARKAQDKGLLKVMAKKGVSVVSSYRQAALFTALGLSQEIINECFPGMNTPIKGLNFNQIEERLNRHHEESIEIGGKPVLPKGGFLSYRKHDGETHANTPETILKLQEAARHPDPEEGYKLYKQYRAMIDENAAHNPVYLRDLVDFNYGDRKPIPLDEVEPVESILKRFATGAMSFGSLSPEAHKTLARAMNRIGGRSNSGEGGDVPEQYGTESDSQVKQVASGRFGNTTEYMVHAEILQKKNAQGAKPGEGGQLPGSKVSPQIARLRHTEPGITLISPNPNHSTYSIEDEGEETYRFHQVNDTAIASNKLVSKVGVGNIAVGSVKAGYAHLLISGNAGGTGASPEDSIKHAGLPWELGLPETQQALVMNKLRHRARVQTDGALRTGKDLMIAGLMGAEEWGFGLTALVAVGCGLVRKCHKNTCPFGIATQDPELRKRFKGTEDNIVNLMTFFARDLREEMAKGGFRTVDEFVGHAQYLKQAKGQDLGLDLSPSLVQTPDTGLPLHCTLKPNERNEYHNPDHPEWDESLDQKILKQEQKKIEEFLQTWEPGKNPYVIEAEAHNFDRAIGTRLSGWLTKYFKEQVDLSKAHNSPLIEMHLRGQAGQSLGAYNNAIKIVLEGVANDYVGLGMTSGTIVIKPDRDALYIENPQENIIVGNVCFYGATGGKAYIGGGGGNRFNIRGSGVEVVLENSQDNTCEYMTAGRMICLNGGGHNFAAGYTGGDIYVVDAEENLEKRLSTDAKIVPLEKKDIALVKQEIEIHAKETGSHYASRLLKDWDKTVKLLKHVVPVADPYWDPTWAEMDAVVIA